MSADSKEKEQKISAKCLGYNVTLTRVKVSVSGGKGPARFNCVYTCAADTGEVLHDTTGQQKTKCPLFGSADCLIQSF